MNDNSYSAIGRMGQDPEISYTQNGNSVCNFSIAVSRAYKKEGAEGFETETTWIPITAWNKLAERVIANAQKGTEVFVKGELREKRWEDKETKQVRSRLYVLAGRLDFGDKRIRHEQGDTAEATKDEIPQKEAPAKTDEKDDLPF